MPVASHQKFFRTINIKRIIFIALATCTLISGIFTAYLALDYYRSNQSIALRVKEQAAKETVQAVAQIEPFFKHLQDTATRFAQDITSGKIPKDKIEEYLKKEIPDDMTGLGVAFAPNAYKPSVHLYAPYYGEREGQDIIKTGAPKTMLHLEDSYDYTDRALYAKPMEKGPTFVDPYFGQATQAIIIVFGTPFYDNNNKKLGVVFAVQSIYKIEQKIKNLNMFENGYGYVLSKNGTYIGHPVAERQQKTIFQIAQEINDPQLAQVAQQALNGQSTFKQHFSPLGEKTWQFFYPIPTSGWSLVNVFFMDQLNLNPLNLQHKRNTLALAFLIFIIFLCLLLLRVYLGDVWRLWTGALAISFLFLCGIVFIWYLKYRSIEQSISNSDDIFIVRDKIGLAQFIKNLDVKLTSTFAQQAFTQTSVDAKRNNSDKNKTTTQSNFLETKHTQIITGLFIQDLEMSSIDSIKFIGQFWQRVPKDKLDKLNLGIVFPAAYSLNKDDSFQFDGLVNNAIGWRIIGTIDQQFNYAPYPFDVKITRIKLWPEDFDKKIILVPDIDAYPVLAPKALPALDKSIEVEGWQIEQTYFSYTKHNYLTNFGQYITRQHGISEASTKSDAPQLIFNILLRRSIASTLMLGLAPIIVIMLLLFLCLFLIHKNLITQIHQILGLTASLFFTTILSHIQFKGTVPVQQIVFFEYFYFILYVLNILVTIIAILYYTKTKIALIHYNHLLAPILFFWPIVTGFILTMSAVSFL